METLKPFIFWLYASGGRISQCSTIWTYFMALMEGKISCSLLMMSPLSDSNLWMASLTNTNTSSAASSFWSPRNSISCKTNKKLFIECFKIEHFDNPVENLSSSLGQSLPIRNTPFFFNYQNVHMSIEFARQKIYPMEIFLTMLQEMHFLSGHLRFSFSVVTHTTGMMVAAMSWNLIQH